MWFRCINRAIMAINTPLLFLLLILFGTAALDQDVESNEEFKKPQTLGNAPLYKQTEQKLIEEINQANMYMVDISDELKKDAGFLTITILEGELINSTTKRPEFGLNADSTYLQVDVPNKFPSSPGKNLSAIQLPTENEKSDIVKQSICKLNESLAETLTSTCAKKDSKKKRGKRVSDIRKTDKTI